MIYPEHPIAFLSLNKKIVGVMQFPDKPTKKAVIFAHGLSNSKSPADIPLLFSINNALLATGYATMRFDFYGSGESDGEFCDKTISIMQQNFFDALTFLQNYHPQLNWIGAVGKSIGGTILGLAGGDPRLSAYVFITTRHSLTPFFTNFWQGEEKMDLQSKVPPTGRVKGPFSLRKNFFTELPKIDGGMAKGLAKITRALVITNGGDEKISLESALQIYQELPEKKQLLIIPGHDHELRVDQDTITTTVIQFLNNTSI